MKIILPKITRRVRLFIGLLLVMPHFTIFLNPFSIMASENSNITKVVESQRLSTAYQTSWSPPQVLVEMGETAVSPGLQDLAIDSFGNWHVVYKVGSGAVRYRNSNTDQLIVNGSGDNPSSPSIAIGPNGVVHITYAYGVPNPDWNMSLYYLNNASGSWSSPQVIANLGSTSLSGGLQDLAVDSNGNWHVVYKHGSGSIIYRNRSLSQTVVTGSGDNPISPSLALDSAGRIHVTYAYADILPTWHMHLYYTNNISGSWSSPVSIANMDTDISGGHQSLAIDANGGWHVAYRDGTGIRYRNPHSSEMVIGGASDNPTSPAISLDPYGGIHITYAYGTPYPNWHMTLYYTYQSPGSTYAGTYHSGIYQNLFNEFLGKNSTDIQSKLINAWNKLFINGSNDVKLYSPFGTDMGYILDPQENVIKSEGMSYGMMIAVQLDQNGDKRDIFNRLWKFAKTKMQHPQGTAREGYFAWKVRIENGTVVHIDTNPAPDGEEWIAMALFFAAGKWGNGLGIFNYQNEANLILEAMRNKEVPDSVGNCGDIHNMFADTVYGPIVVFSPCGNSNTYTDPSYHVPAFYELWGYWANNNKSYWQEAAQTSRGFLNRAANLNTGLNPDYSNFNGSPYLPNGDKDDFWYDAWRVGMNNAIDYAWFAADPYYQTSRNNRLLNFFYSRGQDTLGRLTYVDHYTLSGGLLPGTKSVGLIGMNAAAGLATSRGPEMNVITRKFVDELWCVDGTLSFCPGIPSGPGRYYNSMLYMLGLLNASGRFRIFQPGMSTLSVSADVGGTINLLQGVTYSACIPPGAVEVAADVEMGSTSLPTMEEMRFPSERSSLPDDKIVIGNPFYIHVADQFGNPIDEFLTPITITVTYDSSDIINVNESSLELYSWNENTAEWLKKVTQVDLEGNSITAQILTPGTFVLLGDPKEFIFLPLITK